MRRRFAIIFWDRPPGLLPHWDSKESRRFASAAGWLTDNVRLGPVPRSRRHAAAQEPLVRVPSPTAARAAVGTANLLKVYCPCGNADTNCGNRFVRRPLNWLDGGSAFYQHDRPRRLKIS